MKISAIILSYNSIKYIEKCISSLDESFKNNQKPDTDISVEDNNYEIFIVDNGSKDGSVERLQLLEKQFSQLKVIYFKENTGTTFSRNTALKKAIGDYILILDSDAYISKEPVNYLINYLNKHKECGLAVPKLVYPDGRYQKSTDNFPSVISKLKRFFFLKSIETKESQNILETSDVDYAISAFWLIRKDVLEKVGLLDEKIFYSPEDVDYCIRIWKAGYTIRYFPEVSIIHDAQEISRSKGISINFFTLSHAKGLLYLFYKHHYFFSLNSLYKQIKNQGKN